MQRFNQVQKKKIRLSFALFPLGLLSITGGVIFAGSAVWAWLRSGVSDLDGVMDGIALIILGLACVVFAERLERAGAYRQQNNPYRINTYGGTRWNREDCVDTLRR